MNRIDELGHRPERRRAYSKELLSGTDDKVLREIVEKAAAELSSPMAMVNLVLDHIQFFKSSFGLPEHLDAAKGTHRDVSFCQYVVKDEKPFKVKDAKNDLKIPQTLVTEFGINAYLGVPIYVEDIVIGSLCVLDTKARDFSEADLKSLQKLGQRVNKRLKIITEKRNRNRLEIKETALLPGIRELVETLKPIQDSVDQGYANASSIRSYLDGSKYLLFKNHVFNETTRLSLEAAHTANNLNTDLLADLEMAIADIKDCVHALENLTLNTDFSTLSEIVIAAQDLSRNSTKAVGGFSLPEFPDDPMIYTSSNIAVAVVSNCLLAISNHLHVIESTDGISIKVVPEKEGKIGLEISAEGLKKEAYESINQQVQNLLENEPNIALEKADKSVSLVFNVVS